MFKIVIVKNLGNNYNNFIIQLNNYYNIIKYINVLFPFLKMYSCRAQNDYAVKPLRTYTVLLNVVDNKRRDDENENTALMPPLQNQTILVRTGQTVRLLCAVGGRSDTIIKWEYISLLTFKRIDLNDFGIELIIYNVTNDLHTGIYQCSSGNDKQVC